jgi:putative membrane protein
MRRENNGFWRDIAIGAVGGLIGTVVLEKISSTLYERENLQAKTRENELLASGDPPMQLANRISDDVLRLNLPDEKKEKLAMGIHYAFGAIAGAMFGVVAPRAPFLSTGFGALYGTLFWIVGDEIGMPIMGISKPSQDYPWQTHARAWTAHVGYGAAVVGTFRLANRVAG